MAIPAYISGQDVNLTIPLVDAEGNALTVQAVSWQLLDQKETVVSAMTPVAGYASGANTVQITIPGALNAVAALDTWGNPGVREMRQVQLEVTTDTGVISVTQVYMVQVEQVLIEGVNSFQTYTMGLLVAEDLHNIDGWAKATKRERVNAMIQSRLNIGHLRFRYVFDAYQNIVDNTLGIADITLATPAQYAALPAPFVQALRRAQIYEADFLLGGDAIGDIRRKGAVLDQVGESKTLFRKERPYTGPVCLAARQELTKYLLTRIRTTRA